LDIILLDRFMDTLAFNRVDVMNVMSVYQKHNFLKTFYIPRSLAKYKTIPLVYFLSGVAGSRSLRKHNFLVEVSEDVKDDFLDVLDMAYFYWSNLQVYRSYFRSDRFKVSLKAKFPHLFTQEYLEAFFFSLLVDRYKELKLEVSRKVSLDNYKNFYPNLGIKIIPASKQGFLSFHLEQNKKVRKEKIKYGKAKKISALPFETRREPK